MTKAALGDVADFINGFAFKPEDWHNDGLPIVRIQNLTDANKPINRTTRSVPDKFRVRKGELLVSWSATLGVFTWNRTDEALVNQHIFRVVPSERIDQAFLRHMLEGALSSMERHLHGATMKHVNRGEFLSTEIPLPPIEEQRRIAAVLDQADAIRAKRCQVLAHFDALVRSTFHAMFGDPNRGGWELATLGDVVAQIDNGASPNCEARPAEPDEWGVLKLGAVSYGTFRAGENKAYLGQVGGMSLNEVRPGDVLMTRKNTRELVGAVAVVDDVRPRLLLPDLIFRLELDRTRVDPRYFQAMMMSERVRPAVRNLSSGSAASMPNISKARLRTLMIGLPPIALQRQFNGRVAAINGQRSLIEHARATDDELFASLQTRAFRGEL